MRSDVNRLRFKCLWGSEVNMPPDLDPVCREPPCGAGWGTARRWRGVGGQAFQARLS